MRVQAPRSGGITSLRLDGLMSPLPGLKKLFPLPLFPQLARRGPHYAARYAGFRTRPKVKSKRWRGTEEGIENPSP